MMRAVDCRPHTVVSVSPAAPTGRLPSPHPCHSLPTALQVRAKQYYADDTSRGGHMPILLHGDGAFAGAC